MTVSLHLFGKNSARERLLHVQKCFTPRSLNSIKSSCSTIYTQKRQIHRGVTVSASVNTELMGIGIRADLIDFYIDAYLFWTEK